MKAFHPAALIALLTLALADVSRSALADRDDRRPDHGSEDYLARERNIENRDNGDQPSRQMDPRVSPRHESRQEWRGQSDSGRGNKRDESGRREQSEKRSTNSQELFNQRFYDDRRDNSGYYRRDNPRPVNDVIREVQHRYGGQVIGVQNSEGGSMYRVRVLQRDGRVKTVLVPAE